MKTSPANALRADVLAATLAARGGGPGDTSPAQTLQVSHDFAPAGDRT